jgi:DNA replicative helicase MCM subunit Mcm2 (Cdc46/Mcm family)
MTAHQQHPNEPTENVGNGNDVIELIPTEELQGGQIVSIWFYSFKSKSMTIKFNDRCQNKLIDSIPVDLGDVKQMCKGFCDILQSNGIAEEYIINLENMLIANNPRITEFYTRKEIEQITEGQRRKRERIDKLRNTPPRQVSVAQALMMSEGANVRIKGTFVGGSVKVENMYIRIGFRCGTCDKITMLQDYGESRPIFASEIPSTLQPKSLHKYVCKEGCYQTFGRSQHAETISARRVELRDTEASGDPPNIDVILFNDYALNTEYTEQVIVTGSIQRVNIKGKDLTHIFVGLGTDGPTTGGFDPVDYTNKKESVKIEDADKEEMQQFVDQCNGAVLDELVKKVVPGHIGDDEAKKGLLICAANTGIDSVRMKRRINMLFLGETGNDKSGLAREGIRIVQGSKFASAADSTTNSLICVVDGETGHYRYGPLLTANGAICVVDEIGVMLKEEQKRLQSLMQEGCVNFGRFGFTRPLEGSSAVILTSNPDSISGTFRSPDKIDPNDFPFLGAFKNRIDLIFIFRTNRDPEHLRKYALSKTKNMDDYHKLLEEEGYNYQYLMKHIMYAKTFDPKFSEAAEFMINQYFVDIMSWKSPTDITAERNETSNRLWETLRNIAYGIARLKFKYTVDAIDAKEAIEIYNNQLKIWSQITNTHTPSDPHDNAYQKMVDLLRDKTKCQTNELLPFTFIDLLQEVCKNDIDVDTFTKRIHKRGERDWDVRTNAKIRRIHEKFTKESRDKRIKIVNVSPLTLTWCENGQGQQTLSTTKEPSQQDSHKTTSGGCGGVPNRGESDRSVRCDPGKNPNEKIANRSNNTNNNSGAYTNPNNNSNNFSMDGKQAIIPITPITFGTSTCPNGTDPNDDTRNNRIYELNKEGRSYREIAKLMNIGKSTVQRILKKRLPEGSAGDIDSDKSYQQLNDFFDKKSDISDHSLEQSPCHLIIGSRTEEINGTVYDADENPTDATYTNIVYYCKLHAELGSTFLGEIELHCREKEPENHKAEILKALGLEQNG